MITLNVITTEGVMSLPCPKKKVDIEFNHRTCQNVDLYMVYIRMLHWLSSLP